ncbi:MAG: 1,6-anhydro-N-acetylmuramyl-L-alanine amidase AmpD [Alteromonadaceae bacterium]|nr:1,6-anhydro-N-acetylmuramyl-L-alanine amidase AmpD [Alteromonadaceae bacterium]|tara:strand:+ start:3270 stop:3875 length:606 start_codon:yes stop_codon:yes gene_type:complete
MSEDFIADFWSDTEARPRGWLTQARAVPSPNFNSRPAGTDISLLVIHNISLPPGEFAGEAVEQFFCNRLDCSAHPYYQQLIGMKVSSHLYIRRDGELVQFVSLLDRAWHAGRSSFEGVEECNDYGIGIELEGTDDSPYTAAQYACLASVTRQIMVLFPLITAGRIVGHSHVAPGRKTDPGPAFEWQNYLKELAVLAPAESE